MRNKLSSVVMLTAFACWLSVGAVSVNAASASAIAKAQSASGTVTSIFDRRLGKNRVPPAQWARFVRELKYRHQRGDGPFEFSYVKRGAEYTWKARFEPRKVIPVGWVDTYTREGRPSGGHPSSIIRRPDGVRFELQTGVARGSAVRYRPHDYLTREAFVSARRGSAGLYDEWRPGRAVNMDFVRGRVADLTVDALVAYRYVARFANRFLRRVEL